MIDLAGTIRLTAFSVGFLVHASLLYLLLEDRSRTASTTVFLWINAVAAVFHVTEIVRMLPSVPLALLGLSSREFASAIMQSCLAFFSPMFLHFLLRERHELSPIRGYRIILGVIYLESGLVALVVWLKSFGVVHLLTLYNFFLFLPALLVVGISVLRRWRSRAVAASDVRLWVGMLGLFVGMALIYYAAWIGGFTGRFPHFGWWLSLAGETSSMPISLVLAFFVYRFPFLDTVIRRAIALLSTGAVVMMFQTAVAPAIGSAAQALLASLIAIGTWTLVSNAVREFLFGQKTLIGLREDAQRLLAGRPEPARLIDEMLVLLRRYLKIEQATFRSASPDAEGIPAGGWIRKMIRDPMICQLMDRAQTELVLPIRAGGSLFGTLWLGRRRHHPGYFSEDLEILRMLCSQIGTEVDNHRLQEEGRAQLDREYQLRELAARAELRALRAQIQPHFLFNALNTVASLIRENPRAAEQVVENLSEIFHYALESTRVDLVSLGEEIEFVRAYLLIEKARFEERLEFCLNVPEDCAQVRLPAMTLQPIVENAVRHGIGNRQRLGRIAITAQRSNDGVEISVEDNGDGFIAHPPSPRPGHGIGLENVRSRLQLACGGKAQLGVRSHPGEGTTVSVRIPL